jgi:hypothetical protein
MEQLVLDGLDHDSPIFGRQRFQVALGVLGESNLKHSEAAIHERGGTTSSKNAIYFFSSAACAAARRAMGTRKGLQLT